MRLRPLLALLAVVLAGPAFAASPFPTKPIRIVVPTAPGGALDLTTRLVAQRMSEDLGQPIIVDNRPGADTMLGTRIAKAAAPDGYTILAQTDGLTVTPLLRNDPGFDPVGDFRGIAVMIHSPLLLEVGGDGPDKTLAGFISRARAGDLSFGSAGLGSSTHLAPAMLFHELGLELTHVPYKGNSQALPDVAGGRVDTIFGSYSSSVAFLKSGKLRPLAVSSAERIEPLPDVPTFKEQGVDFVYTLWLGLLAPKGTPEPIVERLAEAVRKATGGPELNARFRAEGSDPTFYGPKAFDDIIAGGVAEMSKLVTELRIPKS